MEKTRFSTKNPDLNRGPPPCKGGALPLSYSPLCFGPSRTGDKSNAERGVCREGSLDSSGRQERAAQLFGARPFGGEDLPGDERSQRLPMALYQGFLQLLQGEVAIEPLDEGDHRLVSQ